MKNIITFALSLILTMSCSKSDKEIRCTGFNLNEPTIMAPEEYAIWKDVFAIKAGTPIIVLQNAITLDSTSAYRLQSDTNYIGFEVDSTLLDHFIQVNDSSEYWDEEFGSTSLVISKSEIDCLFESGISGWEEYYEKYQKGYWSISRPGVFFEGHQWQPVVRC